LLVMAPPSQELEPPINPEQFSSPSSSPPSSPSASSLPTRCSAQTEGQTFISGIVSHGSDVCNVKWMERGGAVKAMDTAYAVKEDDQTIDMFLDRGRSDFDSHRQDNGQEGRRQGTFYPDRQHSSG
jgi:hypothetical protein